MTDGYLIYGASGFGREVAFLIEDIAASGQPSRVAGFVDDREELYGTEINGYPVLSLAEAATRHPDASVVAGVGIPRVREVVMGKAAEAGLRFGTLVHPRVEISRFVEMGEGTVVCAGNILTVNITLGRHVQINLDSTLGHDVVLGDYTTISPGAHVSGWVHMGRRVFVGTGAVFNNGTEDQPLVIGDDAVIGAGACVVRPVPAGTTVVGVPARSVG